MIYLKGFERIFQMEENALNIGQQLLIIKLVD